MYRAWWVIESGLLRSPDKGFWACLGDLPLRHAQTAGDLGFAMQINAETPWHFAQLSYPWVGLSQVRHIMSITLLPVVSRLPRPTSVPAL